MKTSLFYLPSVGSRADIARLPERWLFAWIYNGLIPHAKLMKSIELFATEVLPRFSVGD